MCAFWSHVFGGEEKTKTGKTAQEEAKGILEEVYRNRGKEIISAFGKAAYNGSQSTVNKIMENTLHGMAGNPVDQSVSMWSIPLALCLFAKEDLYGTGIFQSSKNVVGTSQGIESTLKALRTIPGTKETQQSGVTFIQLTINGMDFWFYFIGMKEDILNIRSNPGFFKELKGKTDLSKKILITETKVFSANMERMNYGIPVVREKG